MATHQVQLSLQRAARRPRGHGTLGTCAAALSLAGGAAGVGLCCAGFVLTNSDWTTALGVGLIGAIAGAALVGLLAARLAASLALLARATRQISVGDFRLQLPRGPGSDLIHLANSFSQMAATVAEDRKRLQELNLALEGEQMGTKIRQEVSRLKEIAEAIGASLELEVVVAACLDGVVALLRPEAAWLLLPDANGSLELVGARGLSPEAAQQPEPGFQSQASVPVQLKQYNRTGFICVGAKQSGRFGPHETELLGTIASLTASAVQNARLFVSLSRAKLEWERTFDSISDPIFISDNQFRLIRLNKAASACLGLPLREAAGRVCYQVMAGEDGPCPWHDALARGLPLSSDRYFAHLDKWFSLSAFPFEDGEGRQIGVVHILRDISEEVLKEGPKRRTPERRRRASVK